MELKLQIENGGVLYEPAVEDGMVWETVRKGSPGKLTFSVIKDGALSFTEGSGVRLVVDGAKLFKGFVFTKGRGKGPAIDVTAYDQLRYLKNKDTLMFENMTAAGRLRDIAGKFELECGSIEETGVALPGRLTEENTTLFDMVLNALDETTRQSGRLFVLYDDFGKLALKDVRGLQLDLLIDAETGESFDYTSSIDSQTYNKIKLAYDNKDTGKREVYVAQDGQKMNEWGVLQYFEQLDDPTGAVAKADALLGLYDQKTRNLSVKNVMGDVRVRAGCAVAVALNLGDVVTNNFMVVENVKHTFRNQEHRMDLTLIGGEFIA